MDARTVFISDLHLGSPYCQTAALSKFLYKLSLSPPHTLFIAGDLFDLWQFNRRWKWDDAAQYCVIELLRLAMNGTAVRWVLGNHDPVPGEIAAAVSLLLPDHRLLVASEFIHRTDAGRELLVFHGHQIDPVTKIDEWFHWGDFWYQWLDRFVSAVNWASRCTGSSWKVAPQMFVDPVKHWVHRTSEFEMKVSAWARKRGVGGVVCGHCHVPKVSRMEDGFVYANAGDFLTSCTAVIESDGGALRLERFDG